MVPIPTLPLPPAGEHAPFDAAVLLTVAHSLQRNAQTGSVQRGLRGKMLGLMCADGAEAAAVLFRSAAMELGAHVAPIRPSLSAASTAQEVEHTAFMLGRLYDAVECQGQPAALVQQLALHAGVAVYDGLACAGHSTAALAEQLPHDMPLPDRRRFVVQAVLLATVA
jgi:ornithine carbamoyltransferase